MAATVADLPPDRFSELASYLKGFSPPHPDDEEESLQYWELLAETLRNDLPSKFDTYTEVVSNFLYVLVTLIPNLYFICAIQRLANMNERVFLQDLAKRKFPLTTLKKYLERIRCRPALNIFEDASKGLYGHVKKIKGIFSRGWFRSIDLWVMGPARSHCATLLVG